MWAKEFIYNVKSMMMPATKTRPLFAEMLCDLIFTLEELKNSIVSCKDSNRKRGHSMNPTKLDPTRVLAIKVMHCLFFKL